ncbi:MAG: hypothetical protein JWO38_232 [Gemmataceae bacterium]|nr:hypothetical protein [Gemmataceae bacterium]
MLVGQQIGPFEIEKELGSGAMGTVYRAKFNKGEKVVPIALKVVALGLLGNEGAMARFDREATILKQLRHPHIVRLIATGHWRKTPFIAMEFIDGEALDRVLGRRGRLSWEEVTSYGKQLCEALQHAHDQGIIHRDLKPSNLMITREGTLKLTDFGIAKDTDVTALTGANSTIGTAAYMSPEQCKGDRNLTNKSDLYSLGIVLFELLTGRKPFTADSTVDMFLKHVNEKPPRIGKIIQDLPPKFEALILQLLEKDKDARPIDAAWVGRMLLEVEEDAFARKSAGLDVASARRADRPRGTEAGPIDESDRDAARALKGVKKKKKKKPAAVPWREKKWVKATGILLLLAGLVVAVYLGLRPPSAEKLSAAIEAAKTPAEKLAAAETYLEKYGTRPGEMTDKAAEVYRRGKVREREGQLEKRFANAKMRGDPEGDDPEAYNWAMGAIQAEKDGRLADAMNLWEKVKGKFQEEGKVPYTLESDKLPRARWGWLADDRIGDIKNARAAGAKVETTIAGNRNYEKATTFDPTSPESLATKARRLEMFKDAEKAGRLWETLAAQTEKDPEQREWYLLANEHRVAVPKDAGENALPKRIDLVRGQVDAAEKRLKELKASTAERREWIALRGLCREIIELYEEETDKAVVDAVGRAKQVLDEAKKQA